MILMFRLQVYLLMGKKTLIFIILLSIVLTIAFYYYSGATSGYAWMDQDRSLHQSEYWNESVFLVEFITVSFCVLLHVESFNPIAKRYALFFVDSSKIRPEYLLAKLFAIHFVLALFVFHHAVVFLCIQYLWTPYQISATEVVTVFGKIGVEAAIYGLLQGLFMHWFNQFLSMIIPIGIFWYQELSPDLLSMSDNQVTWILSHVFPNIVYDQAKWQWIHPPWLYGIVVSVFLLIFLVSFQIQDI